MTITIVGLGYGAGDDVSLRAWRTIEHTQTLYLRTTHHPIVHELPDHLSCVSFDDLGHTPKTIATEILKVAQSSSNVVYAVPGDPLIGESTVKHLLKLASTENIDVEIIHGISFIEPMVAQLGVDVMDGIQIFDALAIAPVYHPPLNPEISALIAQVDNPDIALKVKQTLLNQYPADFAVKLVHINDDDIQIEDALLHEIDCSSQLGALTALYVPALGKLTSFEAFQNIIAQLRSPEGCPWDIKQTHQSLRPFLIEEAYEVLETIDDHDPDAMVGELGDLLLQIVLHTQIAIDHGEFYMSDILREVNEKMIRRHPHVWGDVDVNGDPNQVTANWDDIKKAEKGDIADARESILDGVPKGAPALFVSHKYQHKAAKVGFDWDDVGGVEAKAEEEYKEILSAESDEERIKEIGDLMFVLVNWLRWLKVDDPESLMREANAKFYGRFTYVEDQAAQNHKSLSECSLDEMESWWVEAKTKGL